MLLVQAWLRLLFGRSGSFDGKAEIQNQRVSLHRTSYLHIITGRVVYESPGSLCYATHVARVRAARYRH